MLVVRPGAGLVSPFRTNLEPSFVCVFLPHETREKASICSPSLPVNDQNQGYFDRLGGNAWRKKASKRGWRSGFVLKALVLPTQHIVLR